MIELLINGIIHSVLAVFILHLIGSLNPIGIFATIILCFLYQAVLIIIKSKEVTK